MVPFARADSGRRAEPGTAESVVGEVGGAARAPTVATMGNREIREG